MNKQKMTVYDYCGQRNGVSPHQAQRIGDHYEVKEFHPEAYVVGGEDGVRAYWIEGDIMYEAHGDDGHWWLVSTIHKFWVGGMMEALAEIWDEI